MMWRVRATEVEGGIVMVQKMVPVSSSGTSPVLVNEKVATSTTIPIITVVSTLMGLRTSFSTLPLYFPKIFS